MHSYGRNFKFIEYNCPKRNELINESVLAHKSNGLFKR